MWNKVYKIIVMIGEILVIILWILRLLISITTFTAILSLYIKQGYNVAYKVVIEKQSFISAEEEMDLEFEDEVEEFREKYDIPGFTHLSSKFSR